MTNKEIYLGALALIGEPDEYGAADYAERAPFILANFISENAALDNQYRRAHGKKALSDDLVIFASPDDAFPLSSRFAAAAEQYLAAMLLEEEDTERSDIFFDRYCKAMTAILAEIPAVREKIMNSYGV